MLDSTQPNLDDFNPPRIRQRIRNVKLVLWSLVVANLLYASIVTIFAIRYPHSLWIKVVISQELVSAILSVIFGYIIRRLVQPWFEIAVVLKDACDAWQNQYHRGETAIPQETISCPNCGIATTYVRAIRV